MSKVKITRTENADREIALPRYQTEGSAGIDLRANLGFLQKDEIRVIPPANWIVIPTGLCIEMPDTMEAQIRSRSGLAAKHGIVVLNSPGTIDADYRGEIKIMLMNHGISEFIIRHGDRIAQMVFADVIHPRIEEVASLGETDRGAGGLGSTGTK